MKRTIILFILLLLNSTLFADAKTCSLLVDRENKLMKNILQLQQARQVSIAKMKSNLFQLNLIEMRTECKNLPAKVQYEADLTIKSFNNVEELLVKSGYLKASSI